MNISFILTPAAILNYVIASLTVQLTDHSLRANLPVQWWEIVSQEKQ